MGSWSNSWVPLLQGPRASSVVGLSWNKAWDSGLGLGFRILDVWLQGLPGFGFCNGNFTSFVNLLAAQSGRKQKIAGGGPASP